MEEVLQRYEEAAKSVKRSGPTSFAPVIKQVRTGSCVTMHNLGFAQAMRIVEQSGNQYHILLIIADGQVPLNTHVITD